MNRHMEAQWEVVRQDEECVMIHDIGSPWLRCKTITNDIENVLKELFPQLNGRRFFYFDSDTELAEVVYDKDSGNFIGFVIEHTI